MNKILSFLVLFLFTFFSCTTNDKSINPINGHWHLFSTETESEEYFYKLDIKHDSIAILEGFNYFGPIAQAENELELRKNIIQSAKKMLLWIDGMYWEFNYSTKGDTLLLHNNNKTKYIGLRQDEHECNKQLDFFSTQLVSINLEAFEDVYSSPRIKDLSNVLNVYIGVNKITRKPAIQFNERIISIDNIDIELEKFKATIPLNKQNRPRLIFYVDKDVNHEIIEELVKKLDSSIFTDIYKGILNDEQIKIVPLNSIHDIIKIK